MAVVIDANVIKLPSLHWHSSNRLFKDQTNSGLNYYLKMSAHIGDSIDLICPRGTAGNSSNYEHTIIYKVSSKYEFDNCIINPNNYDTVPILKCDKPQSSGTPTKFTVYFVKYSPVPNALEFEEDKEYYFLSTSSGTRDGLAYMSGGVCAKYNMRFAIKIKPSIMSSELNSGLQATPKSSGGGNHKQYNTNVLLDNEASNELLKAKLSTSRPNKFFGSLINSHNHNHHQRSNDSGYALSGDDTKQLSNQQPQVSNLNLISSASCHSSTPVYLLLLLVTYLLTK